MSAVPLRCGTNPFRAADCKGRCSQYFIVGWGVETRRDARAIGVHHHQARLQCSLLSTPAPRLPTVPAAVRSVPTVQAAKPGAATERLLGSPPRRLRVAGLVAWRGLPQRRRSPPA
uniref:Uncharacterized protein n=1 Tax=Oryza glumipatula TaxID=40148 RepID=A0A0E0B7H1_9ORYZ